MIQLHNDDCLNVLASLDENSIDALITDPPAGISFMGKAFDTFKSRDHFIETMVPIYRECLRVGMDEKVVSHHMITGSGKPSESVKERSADGQPNRFTSAHQNNHPTVKSTKLMSYLINLITPPHGVILDCFMGSGSTGVAAKRLGFGFVGIEKEADYFEIAKRRIDHG